MNWNIPTPSETNMEMSCIIEGEVISLTLSEEWPSQYFEIITAFLPIKTAQELIDSMQQYIKELKEE